MLCTTSEMPTSTATIGTIHTSETLKRRVMPDREGKALAITLLSSDVGKLYVALAQAIERLR